MKKDFIMCDMYGQNTVQVGKEVRENRVKGGFHHEGNLWPKYCSNGGEGTKIRIR